MLLDLHDDVSDAAIPPQDRRSRLTIGRLMVGIAIFAAWLGEAERRVVLGTSDALRKEERGNDSYY